jgi:hypothetical protein
MLVELGVAEQRYRAVLEVLDGAAVTVVARRFGAAGCEPMGGPGRAGLGRRVPVPNRPAISGCSSSPSTSIVADRLCGFIPITTLPINAPLTLVGTRDRRREGSAISSWSTPLEPLLVTVPGETHARVEPHQPAVGSRCESPPPDTSTPAWPDRNRLSSLR